MSEQNIINIVEAIQTQNKILARIATSLEGLAANVSRNGFMVCGTVYNSS